jgi:NAD+ synthase
MNTKPFSTAALDLNCQEETSYIIKIMRNTIINTFKKRGAVVALSGGIDSSVVGALCVEALGKDRVFGLLMPEKDSSDDTAEISERLVKHLGISHIYKDITPILESLGCYEARDNAIRSILSEYTADYKFKIVLPTLANADTFRIFSIVVQSPDGKTYEERLTPAVYLEILAATNFKQRVRKMLEYYHADRLNFAVAGTPNRQEYDQGFFVKLGDGAADIKPIAHLYKTQVYQLAAYLKLPKEILNRQPTTDTYSLSQSQEEFYFSVPYQIFDICLYGKNHNVPISEVAAVAKLSIDQVNRIYHDIDNKRKSTQYLHSRPTLIREIKELFSNEH